MCYLVLVITCVGGVSMFFCLRAGLLLAWRAGFLAMGTLFVVVSLLAALMAGEFSGRQPATVALDVGLSVIRLLLPLVLVLLVQELFSRDFERRHFLYSLTYPVSRIDWFLGRFSAVILLVLLLLFVVSGLLSGVVYALSSLYEQSTPVGLGFTYWVVIGFLAVDIFVLAALAGFISLVASTPSFVLVGTLGFMLVARSYSAIVSLLVLDGSLVLDAESYLSSIGWLKYFLPDLGALDVRMIALYGHIDLLPPDWFLLVVSGLSYSLFFLGLALLVFQFKRFS